MILGAMNNSCECLFCVLLTHAAGYSQSLKVNVGKNAIRLYAEILQMVSLLHETRIALLTYKKVCSTEIVEIITFCIIYCYGNYRWLSPIIMLRQYTIVVYLNEDNMVSNICIPLPTFFLWSCRSSDARYRFPHAEITFCSLLHLRPSFLEKSFIWKSFSKKLPLSNSITLSLTTSHRHRLHTCFLATAAPVWVLYPAKHSIVPPHSWDVLSPQENRCPLHEFRLYILECSCIACLM